MKIIVIAIINFYQLIVSPILSLLLGGVHSCKFVVSCSEYTKQEVLEHGILTGLKKGLLRVLSCHPYGSFRKSI